MSLSVANITKIKDTIRSLVNQHFPSTLGKEPDIVNIVNAQILYESGYKYDALGKPVSRAPGTGGYLYLSSSAVTNILNTGDSVQKANVEQGLRAIGLMQVMGWNFVKGGSPSGRSELERLRPDLASTLVVNPGDNIFTPILGEANINKAILAGLIILEGKYKATLPNGNFFTVKGDPYKRLFVTKLAGALGAYLGLGRSDLNSTTPENYSAQIIGGSTYAKANGVSPIFVASASNRLISSNGPQTNGSAFSGIKQKGC